jgi:hypothetical protein
MSVFLHGGPVEAVEWMNSTNPQVPIWLLSAGRTTLKVWNPVSGTCVCTLPAQHRKTMTSLLSMPRQKSGNQDHFHATHYRRLGWTYAHMGASVQQRKRRGEPPAGTFAFFTRGMNANPGTGDHIVAPTAGGSSSKKRKLAKFDLALKQFWYGDALDEALETRIPQAVVAVLEELGKRRGLAIALSNRDEESLEPILAFTVRYVTRPRFAALLIGVANKLIDIYAEVTGQSETIDKLFAKLKNQVTEECRTQKILFHVVGQLDAVLTQAEMDQRDF